MADKDVDMENSSDDMEKEKKVEFLLEAFHAVIRTLLSTADVKKLIFVYQQFDAEEKKRLGEYAENKVPSEIFDEIVNSIRNMKDKPLKYSCLDDAFQEIGHEKTHLILTGVALPTNTTHKDLIFKFGNDICENLNIQEILPSLLSLDLVSEEERQLIQRKLDGYGNWFAAFQLLICVSNKKVDWYPKFMDILLQNKHADLANRINQELKKMRSDGADTSISMTPIADARPSTSNDGYSWRPSTSNDGYSWRPSTSNDGYSWRPSTSNDGYSSTMENVMSVQEDPEPMDDLDAPPPPVPKRFDSLQETEQMDNESVNEIKRTNLNDFNIKPERTMSISVDDVTNENENQSLIYSRTQDTNELVLKDYQLELAENAIAGKNTVICAGTGTGKTFVALHIVKDHLSSEVAKGVRKVVFMASTSALIKQQADRCKKYLPQFQTKHITGESEESSAIGIFLEHYDILCLTPKVLENNLDSGSVKSLTELSLLILDECHHTRKDEPYHNLMRKYLIEKHANKRLDLPQVVGLTASIGVGKSHNDEDALDYMVHLFASLDVRDLSTVQRKLDSYNQEISHATEELITMEKPSHNPCRDILLEAVEEAEDKLQDVTSLIPEMVDLVCKECPEDKESQEYNQWTVELEKAAIMHNAADAEIARNIRTCAIFLNVYNAAFEVNTLLGPVDVMRFLAKKHAHESSRDNKEKLTDVENELLNHLQDVQRQLRKQRKLENQNVQKLCDTLKNMMTTNPEESRAMVFVEARVTCVSLADIMKTKFKELGIKVHYLFGKETRGGEDGMTESVQNETVEKFRKGDYKVLVATSVGIEGIDVPDCNIVLNYNFQGNEITKIQMKGRSRKKEGHNVIIGNEKLVERQKINAYKEAMMLRAQKRFLQLDPKIIERKVALYQQEEMSRYRMRKETERIKRSKKSAEKEFQLLCKGCGTFACFTSDIKMSKNQHIVIDESFKERIDMKPHKNPKSYDGFNMKWMMHCKKCPLDWGTVSQKWGFKCRTLKLASLKFRDMTTGRITTFKKWLDVPTQILEIDDEDLIKILNDVQKD